MEDGDPEGLKGRGNVLMGTECYVCDLMEWFPDMGWDDHCDHPKCPCGSAIHPFGNRPSLRFKLGRKARSAHGHT